MSSKLFNKYLDSLPGRKLDLHALQRPHSCGLVAAAAPAIDGRILGNEEQQANK